MPWIREVLDEDQFAMKGGTLKVAARAALYVERIVSLKKETWGFSLDFSRLFNSLCPHLSGAVACRLGLAIQDVDSLLRPIVLSRTFWRFPRQEVTAPVMRGRGLPQGLKVAAFSFVDDVHVVAEDVFRFKRALDFIQKYAWDFCLELSSAKSTVWGSKKDEAATVAEQYGFGYSDSIVTMGAEWVIRGKEAKYLKEFHLEA